MLIQIHILQNYAPSNLNRDDSGSPKDAIFGGATRGRISSQCLKRSIRKSETFREAFENGGWLGVRTKNLPGLVRTALEQQAASPIEIEAIVKRVPKIGQSDKKKKNRKDGETPELPEKGSDSKAVTQQLIFLAQNEVSPLAAALLRAYRASDPKMWEKVDIDKSTGAILPRSVDIAMFGRMTTADTFEDVRAAVQVAHALSTNALAQEFDYYTAVDDLSGESGAGMIGDVEFNSSTYYKYLNIHWEELLRNLGGSEDNGAIARRAVMALLEAFALAQPSGKQNSFAAYSLPDFILVEVSQRNLPVSYANAFIKPARANVDHSLMDASVQQLSAYMERLSKSYNLTSQRAYLATADYTLPLAQPQPSLADLQTWLDGQLPR